MATADMVTTREAEAERVLRWRLDELERAGYDRAAAWELAERADIDLHLATDLVRAGCPFPTALRILL